MSFDAILGREDIRVNRILYSLPDLGRPNFPRHPAVQLYRHLLIAMSSERHRGEGSKKREGPVAAAIEPMISATAELDELFRTQHGRVLRAAYRITGSMADAEDVAQNVFLRIAQQGVCRGAIDNPDSYVYRAAINGALDLLRKRQREGAVPIEDTELLSGTVPVDRASEAREMVSIVRSSLTRLSPRAAEMFVLRYVEDRDLADIAHLLNTSRAVVAVMLHRTRARLRSEFKAQTRGTK